MHVSPMLRTTFITTQSNNNLRRYFASKTKKKIPSRLNPEAVTLEQALPVLRAFSVGRLEETFELHVKCQHDKKITPIRGWVRLPQSITETSILAVFAQGSAAEEARKAGADLVLGPEEIPLVAQGRYEFAKTLAHPATFPALVKIARWLGPRGLMPSLKQGTVTENLVQAIQDSKGRMDYKADKKNVLHTGIAKVKFTDAQIKGNSSLYAGDVNLWEENIEYLLQEILNSHVQGSKVSRNSK